MAGTGAAGGADPRAESVPLPAATQVSEAVAATSLLAWARRRLLADRLESGSASLIAATTFMALAVAWPAMTPIAAVSLLALGCYVVTQAVAASVEFEIGPGFGIPTAAVMGAAIFSVPASLIPVGAFAGLALASLVVGRRQPERRESPIALAISAWHSVGPAAVIAVWGPDEFSVATIGVCALALGAQLVIDFVAAWIRNCVDHGVEVSGLVESFRFTGLIDLLLFPVGVMAAAAVSSAWFAPTLVLPVIALLNLFQRDRSRYLDHALALRQAFQQSAGEARTDSLTGLPNRMAWDERFEQATTGRRPTVVVLLDIDGLKAANDTLGHHTGDRLIVAVADVVRLVRPDDALSARLGGDEFGLLLTESSVDAAELRSSTIAEDLRRAFDTTDPIDGRVPVQASIGVAVAATGADLSAAMAEADRAVNRDKIQRGVRRGSPGAIA